MGSFSEGPRPGKRLTADRLSTEGCVGLVSAILEDAARNYLLTREHLNRRPHDWEALTHKRHLEDFYRSDYFQTLACGMVDGETVMRELDRKTENGEIIRRRYENVND